MNESPRELIGGRYQILTTLGRGGMGVVYKAYDPVLERDVAIKQMATSIVDSDEHRRRFQIEARAAARLNHPNIVTIYELEEHHGDIYIVMELLEGLSLGALLQRRTPPPLEAQLAILAQVCDGLDFAHSRAIVHRDIKPANLILLPSGIVKILDFGIAQLAASDLTRQGAVLGTPNYMAPEQVNGEPVDARADLFSVGAVAYELAAGVKAFSGDSVPSLLMKIAEARYTPLSQVAPDTAPGLAALVARLLSRSRDDRPARGGEVRAALEQIGAVDRLELVADTVAEALSPSEGDTLIQLAPRERGTTPIASRSMVSPNRTITPTRPGAGAGEPGLPSLPPPLPGAVLGGAAVAGSRLAGSQAAGSGQITQNLGPSEPPPSSFPERRQTPDHRPSARTIDPDAVTPVEAAAGSDAGPAADAAGAIAAASSALPSITSPASSSNTASGGAPSSVVPPPLPPGLMPPSLPGTPSPSPASTASTSTSTSGPASEPSASASGAPGVPVAPVASAAAPQPLVGSPAGASTPGAPSAAGTPAASSPLASSAPRVSGAVPAARRAGKGTAIVVLGLAAALFGIFIGASYMWWQRLRGEIKPHVTTASSAGQTAPAGSSTEAPSSSPASTTSPASGAEEQATAAPGASETGATEGTSTPTPTTPVDAAAATTATPVTSPSGSPGPEGTSPGASAPGTAASSASGVTPPPVTPPSATRAASSAASEATNARREPPAAPPATGATATSNPPQTSAASRVAPPETRAWREPAPPVDSTPPPPPPTSASATPPPVRQAPDASIDAPARPRSAEPPPRTTVDAETVSAFQRSGDATAVLGGDQTMAAAATVRIKDTLERYGKAIQERDLDTLRGLREPIAPAEQKLLDGPDVTVRFSDIDVDVVAPTSATAHARRTVTIAGQPPATDTVTVRLMRKPTGWVITSIAR